MKYLTILSITIMLILSACNCTPFKRQDVVTVSIQGEVKFCYCTVQYVKLNQMVRLVCEDGNKYEAEAANLIKCGYEHNYELKCDDITCLNE